MSEPFLGQVIPVAFAFAPQGWHFCDGSLLPIGQYDALFALLGTTYGGDGQNTFALPDLRGRAALGAGQGAGLQPYTAGQQGGTETVGLSANQYASHRHALSGADSATTPTPGPTVTFGTSAATEPLYGASGAAAVLTAGTVAAAPANGAPHDNLQPFTTVNYIISLQGIFPSRS